MNGPDLSLRAQAAAIAAGELDPGELLDATLARIEERNPAINAVVETFPERSREMLASRPRGPLHGVPIVIKDEWPLPWRAQRFGSAQLPAPVQPAPAESGPLPGAARRRRRDRRRRQHARAGLQQHRQRLGLRRRAQPLGHRALPGRLFERASGGDRGSPGRGGGRRRRPRLGPLPRRLLRPDRAEADLRPLGDGRPPHGRDDEPDRLRPALRRRRRLPPARLGPLRRDARRRGRRRTADRRRPRRRLRGRHAGGPRRPATRRPRRCAPRPAARCARSSSPTWRRRPWPRS